VHSSKQTKISAIVETTIDYSGNFVYEEGSLKYILTPEGRVMKNPDGTFNYQYFLKVGAQRKSRHCGNHLGNTRVTFDQIGTTLQEDSYYPFGMAMSGLSYQSGTDYPNKYLYNGKELQDEFGLGWYDYGARFYDQALGRWHVIDKYAEKYYGYSPYIYAMNNPLRFIDPDGNDGWDIVKVTGLIVGGVVQWVGGVAAASILTGVGQIGGVALIMNGSANIAWGTAVLVNNGKKDIPTGTGQAIGRVVDNASGNENHTYEKIGTGVDFVSGLPSGLVSTPLKIADAAATTVDAVSTVETVQDLNNSEHNPSESNSNGNDSSSQDSSTSSESSTNTSDNNNYILPMYTAPADNTRVNQPKIPLIGN